MKSFSASWSQSLALAVPLRAITVNSTACAVGNTRRVVACCAGAHPTLTALPRVTARLAHACALLSGLAALAC